MEKVIAIMDKPKDCQECVFGVYEYNLPLSTLRMRKGYYCQLKEPNDREVEEFYIYEDVHLKNCPLKTMPEKKDPNKALTWEHKKILDGYNLCIDRNLVD